MPSPYTGDTLVQQTTAAYLEQQLGWESVYAHNHEDFGPDSLLGRASERDVVLTRPLHEKLAALSPGLPDGAYDEAVRRLMATTVSQTIVAANHDKYDLVRDGVQVTYRDDKGKPTQRRLRVIDFDEPANNHFLCVREMWVRRDPYRRRPDILGFVNGLPLLFIECRNIQRDLKAAFEKNYADYRDTVPHLFHHNAVVMFGNGEKARIGSITSRWGHFHEWKRLAEDKPRVVDMETLLKGVRDRRNFLDLVENFILFDESTGETRKILARNHQFLGVNRAVEAVRDRKARQGKLGVFWHTQGAGKSYSMVMFSRKVRRKLGGNFTFLVLTDRDDLDTRIYKTYAGCGVVDHDGEPCRAGSGGHLRRLLGEHKSHVFSLIQKFNQDVDAAAGYTSRDDVIVISDEAHRTQYGTLGLNMRNALPNASYIGFTGTPLFTGDEVTRQVFGDYVSTYDFQRAVEDGATVPLYYSARGEQLGVAIGDLNERIAGKLAELEIDDIDVAQRLEQELNREYHVVTAGERLDQIARDFVHHYSAAWETGKAMLVCIDKLTCVRMHALIERYWRERVEALEAEHAKAPGEQEAIYLRRQIDWMRDTRAAVVVSEEQGEVEKFRRWNLDIVPHRRLVKEGMELPPAMRADPRFRNMQRMAVDDAFKEQEHPFRIAVVCAMWLTGFDVPSLSTLYLDTPLKAHTLMQAIARANRVNEGKNNGLVRKLHQVVDEAIVLQADRTRGRDPIPYDISAIDFDRLKREFEHARERRTRVQALKHTVEQRLQRLLARNPLRTDFQQHYEAIVTEYNCEKDRVTIERTFEELLKFVQELEKEEGRALREGLDEESLAVFDLLKKPDLGRPEIERIKKVAKDLLQTLKAEKLRVDQWREKDATQSAVKVAIHDFLYSDETGLPASAYSDDDVTATSEAVFAHVYRAYPTVPSPYYDGTAAA